MAADLVIKNGWVVTPDEIFKGGVAIANQTIVAIGANDSLPQGKEEIDVKGKHILPGIIDGHVHLMGGSFQLLEVDLKNTRDEAEFTRMMGDKAKTLRKGRWLLGGNWDEEAWPDATLPTRWMIDPVTPDNPVFISRYDGHAGLANSAALKLAGITRDTPDPQGGQIVRDPKTGEMKIVASATPRSNPYGVVINSKGMPHFVLFGTNKIAAIDPVTMEIKEYMQANRWGHDIERARRLLLHKHEIDKLATKVSQKGFTLIPLSLYFKGHRVKVELALVTAKKHHDKRQAKKEADAQREIDRAVRRR